MRYYWLRDCMTQLQFNFFWDKGTNNNADYHTKHHATKYHRIMRPRYVQDKLLSMIAHNVTFLSHAL